VRIRIHRGAHEVGGNCVEVEAADGSRIVLDAGLPLDRSTHDRLTLPQFAGPVTAVFVSHPHLDHYGLVGRVAAAAPVFIGAEAARLLAAAASFSPVTVPVTASGWLRDRTPITVAGLLRLPEPDEADLYLDFEADRLLPHGGCA
jgi:ribonuclease J